MIGLFALSGAFDPDSRARGFGSASSFLFFSVLIAYIIPVFHFISERTVAALQVLRNNGNVDPDSTLRVEARIHRKPRRWFAIVLGIAAAAAVVHNLLLARAPGGILSESSRSTAAIAAMPGTTLTWLIMTLVVSALLDDARMLAGLAREVRIQLLNPERLRPFASTAVLSTLALIGAQAAFPILMIDSDAGLVAFIPGMIATAGPMVLIAIRPIWPLHERLAEARRSLLDELNQHIASALPPEPAHPETLARLAPLLTYRREIQNVSEWPFDLGTMTRLGLYLIIPPLTWVGAALIERLVDTVW